MQFFGRSILWVILCLNQLYAEAFLQTTLKNSSVFEGDSATLTIRVKGEKVVLPKINSVNGNEVVERGGKIRAIEGEEQDVKEYEYNIIFFPKESTTLETFNIVINGKTYTTEPLKLNVAPHPKPPYSIEYNIEKSSIAQNELFKITMKFCYDETLGLSDVKIEHPSVEGLWVQSIEYRPTSISPTNQVVYEIDYYVYATKPGEVKIGATTISANQLLKEDLSKTQPTTNNAYSRTYKRTFTSKATTLKVLDVSKSPYVGTFSLNAITDKKQLDGNETMLLAVQIKGYGNFDELKPFTLSLANATAIAHEPIVRSSRRMNDVKEWEWIQRFSIGNAKSDIVIPRFELRYFDPATKRLEVTSSQEIIIPVEHPIIDESIKGGGHEVRVLPWYEIEIFEGVPMHYLVFILGCILGLIAYNYSQKMYIIWVYYRLFLPLSYEELLRCFLPYKNQHIEIDKSIFLLEKRLYIDKTLAFSLRDKYDLFMTYKMISSKFSTNDQAKRRIA